MDHNGKALDSSLFEKIEVSFNEHAFTVRKQDLSGKAGKYQISYRAYLASYPEVELVKSDAFSVEILGDKF